ncbi:unnamed protein product [Didymodactylos carnosus]|uniref:Poly [ADP-ribose] polymerase n=3 Tax=Didymodactylos carnosus TaxID=1234261 RepID=A0A813Q4F6_9BILA|nr:unnamed protein product [Didymodactylos carnosus]CAF3542816.1 unnamed protein product [Didymodactylos carnosus]
MWTQQSSSSASTTMPTGTNNRTVIIENKNKNHDNDILFKRKRSNDETNDIAPKEIPISPLKLKRVYNNNDLRTLNLQCYDTSFIKNTQYEKDMENKAMDNYQFVIVPQNQDDKSSTNIPNMIPFFDYTSPLLLSNKNYKSQSSSSTIIENNKTSVRLVTEESTPCDSCKKQMNNIELLRKFNCTFEHTYCLGCIIKMTKQCIASTTRPKCLVDYCNYQLTIDDINYLPIELYDIQLLLKLYNFNVKQEQEVEQDVRLKCDKCSLYYDSILFDIHLNECTGRGMMIPCEVCFCPYEFSQFGTHTLQCTNDDDSTLVNFLYNHIKQININKMQLKAFIKEKRRNKSTINVYEIIESFDVAMPFTYNTCDACTKVHQTSDIHIVYCVHNHPICFECYSKHVDNQMLNNQILTCHKCDYHLQDNDLKELRVSDEMLEKYQTYQNNKSIEDITKRFSDQNDEVQSSVRQQTTTIIPMIKSETTTVSDNGPRCECILCRKFHAYESIFVYACNCKTCYGCFSESIQKQRQANEILSCPSCLQELNEGDLSQLLLTKQEIAQVRLYQQGKLFESDKSHINQLQNGNGTQNQNNGQVQVDDEANLQLTLIGQKILPKYWDRSTMENFSKIIVSKGSTEYLFVLGKFQETMVELYQNTIDDDGSGRGVGGAMINNVQPTSVNAPMLTNNGGIFATNANVMNVNPQPFFLNNTTPNFNVQPTGMAINPFGSQFVANFKPIPRPRGRNRIMSNQRPPVPAHVNNMVLNGPHPAMMNVNGHKMPYTQILQIERIQNQRWFKQYSAHQEEFLQRLGATTETWLFHGCSDQAAKNIQQECFNRSHAGVNGTAFGGGAYFAKCASYSHNFAKPDRTNTRRMFLARVLTGKSTPGNASMRVPPPGFDTTTE